MLEWLKQHLLVCPSKYFLRIDCPGCGLQRSLIALAKGDVLASLSLYPATLPMIMLLVYTGLHLKMDFRYGASVIKWGFIGCTAIVLIFYIYKIFTHKLIE
jgi:hypothetical protein